MLRELGISAWRPSRWFSTSTVSGRSWIHTRERFWRHKGECRRSYQLSGIYIAILITSGMCCSFSSDQIHQFTLEFSNYIKMCLSCCRFSSSSMLRELGISAWRPSRWSSTSTVSGRTCIHKRGRSWRHNNKNTGGVISYQEFTLQFALL